MVRPRAIERKFSSTGRKERKQRRFGGGECVDIPRDFLDNLSHKGRSARETTFGTTDSRLEFSTGGFLGGRRAFMSVDDEDADAGGE